MQSQAEAERVAYQNVLAEAERHMEEAPVERRCVNCAYFRELGGTLGLSVEVEHALSFCGSCEWDGTPFVVDRSNTDDIEECFTPRRD